MFKGKTYEELKKDILSNIKGVSVIEGSFVHDMISSVSMELEKSYKALEMLLSIFFLDGCTGVYLDRAAADYCLERKKATAAIGEVTFSGAAGTVVSENCLVLSKAGHTYKTTAAVTIDDTETAVAPIRATKAGAKYNCAPGDIFKTAVSIKGINTLTNLLAVGGGADEETDDDLRERIYFRRKNQSTSGNEAHYREWARMVEGIGDARIFPLYSGAGTVGVMPITYDKRKPDERLITEVSSFIETVRPIGAGVVVFPPVEVAINITASLSLSNGADVLEIKEKYTAAVGEYIKNGVLNLGTIDFYRCLSLLYGILGVETVSEFRINGGTENIILNKTSIQVLGDISLHV